MIAGHTSFHVSTAPSLSAWLLILLAQSGQWPSLTLTLLWDQRVKGFPGVEYFPVQGLAELGQSLLPHETQSLAVDELIKGPNGNRLWGW